MALTLGKRLMGKIKFPAARLPTLYLLTTTLSNKRDKLPTREKTAGEGECRVASIDRVVVLSHKVIIEVLNTMRHAVPKG